MIFLPQIEWIHVFVPCSMPCSSVSTVQVGDVLSCIPRLVFYEPFLQFPHEMGTFWDATAGQKPRGAQVRCVASCVTSVQGHLVQPLAINQRQTPLLLPGD